LVSHLRVPVISVLGYKDSGKTLLIEGLVKGLTGRGLKVATAKHISQRGFTIDREGKDTWRHSKAGANPVLSVSEGETAILIKENLKSLSIDRLLGLIPEVDVFILEGFSWLTLKDERVGKIICVRDEEESELFKGKVKGDLIAVCSLKKLNPSILDIKGDIDVIVSRVSEYIDGVIETLKILGKLPGLNCGKCGFKTCWGMAKAVRDGTARLDDCFVIKHKSKVGSSLTVDGSDVPLQPFVSEVIRRTVLGIASTLKGISIKGDEYVHIDIRSRRHGKP